MSSKKPAPFLLRDKRWESPYFLAPVAGYSDVAFRAVCAELGAALCYTEMISAEALVRGHIKTRDLLRRDPSEAEYAVQLFGAKADTMAKAVEIVSAYDPVVIDLNCGCPVPKIIKAGAGSALIRDPERLGEIVRAMCAATAIPISGKLRTGWDQNSINYLETAAVAVEAGVCAITLHGRTRAQGYSGKADWNAIKTLADSVPVPVFGSGDVFTANAARAMRQETGCDAIMIARGAMGNPFIFSELTTSVGEEAPEAQTAPPRPSRFLTPETVVRVATRHLLLSIQYLGEKTACLEFRKQFCAYTKGFPGGAEIRARAVQCTTFAEYETLLREFLEKARPQPTSE